MRTAPRPSRIYTADAVARAAGIAVARLANFIPDQRARFLRELLDTYCEHCGRYRNAATARCTFSGNPCACKP